MTGTAPSPDLTPPADLPEQVAAALREDIGAGDITAELVPEGQRVTGRVITREPAVLCGRPWAEETFRRLDPGIRLTWRAGDGDRVEAGAVIFEIEGRARPILSGERTAINFLQLLSATATETSRFVAAIAGTGCRVLDTRKTLPGLRSAQKYAVRCGGGRNHRLGLYDMVLIKENHIAAAGSITAAITSARRLARGVPVEVEVESLDELAQALRAQPDIVLLDDFSLADLAAAVSLNRARAQAPDLPPVALEASGSVTLETVRAIAATGVDFVSAGSLTKNVRAIDLSMRLDFSRQTAAAAPSLPSR
jgi:nicotinate-nucleotide pyrophosphorylase (carboxylating)